eukprot:1175087-Amphidinium_carterae.1
MPSCLKVRSVYSRHLVASHEPIGWMTLRPGASDGLEISMYPEQRSDSYDDGQKLLVGEARVTPVDNAHGRCHF